jgi:hypothetical protein
MEDDMVADAALWVIFAVAIVLIACGCHFTQPAPQIVDKPYEREIDRAA